MLYSLHIFLTLTSIILYGINRKALNNNWVLYFLILGLVTDMITRPFRILWFYHFYHILEYSIVALAIHKELKNERFKRFMIKSFPVFFILFIAGIFIDGFYSVSSTNMVISAAACITYCLVYLKETYQPPFIESTLLHRPFFWFSSGLLMFVSTTFFSFIIDGVYPNHQSILSKLTYSTAVSMNYFFHLYIIIGITCRKQFR